MRYFIVLAMVLCCLCGCKNVYQDAVKESLSSWPYWQERYYIQHMDSYEILDPYYVNGLAYTWVWVNIADKNYPANEKNFRFFIPKDRPFSNYVIQNKEWFKFMEMVKNETHLLTETN